MCEKFAVFLAVHACRSGKRRALQETGRVKPGHPPSAAAFVRRLFPSVKTLDKLRLPSDKHSCGFVAFPGIRFEDGQLAVVPVAEQDGLYGGGISKGGEIGHATIDPNTRTDRA